MTEEGGLSSKSQGAFEVAEQKRLVVEKQERANLIAVAKSDQAGPTLGQQDQAVRGPAATEAADFMPKQSSVELRQLYVRLQREGTLRPGEAESLEEQIWDAKRRERL